MEPLHGPAACLGYDQDRLFRLELSSLARPLLSRKACQKRWFAFYAEHFDTVEINNSFYRLPRPETVDGWRDQAPSGFCYAAKANRYLTQALKLKNCEEPMERMMESFRHFGPALGPVLYQLPPSIRLDLDRLDSFLKLQPADITPVFEFRHPSWYQDGTYELLERHGAIFCVHDMAGSASPRIATGSAAYVRFHGAGGKYWGRYPEAQLRDWAEWMRDQARHGRAVWAYFNNDMEAHAIADALALKAMAA
ncbi:DUF72 domain-containing protein [Sphingobium sp. DC-2]|uniref:DUF72 domain-containing protein n=1 Tax=Sphingobium sp. DC-2 TaxID=1303256 RepID=UPI000AD25583|nr:DUF72 domain-containing protein [Sphingobium sp. DC-2]